VSRAAPRMHVYSFLTRDGAEPAELLERGRTEVRGYGGEVLTGQVVSAAPVSGGASTVALNEVA
jgi:hypothetical protein